MEIDIHKLTDRINKLDTIEKCEQFKKNLESFADTNNVVIDELCFLLAQRRINLRTEELADKIADETLPHDFIIDASNALSAYEDFLAFKNQKKQKATYLRRAIKNNGLVQALANAVSKKTTQGYGYLVEQGLTDYLLEKVVVDHSQLFDAEVVELAKNKLKELDA